MNKFIINEVEEEEDYTDYNYDENKHMNVYILIFAA